MLTDQELLALHTAGRSVYSISAEFGIPHTSLHRRMVKLGLDLSAKSKIRTDPVKDMEARILALHAEGKDRREIAESLGCHRSSVSRLLKRHGLGSSIQTWSYDVDFFSIIDTEAKAYTLGFFTADGCNTLSAAAIRIADRDVLEKIVVAMKYSGNIRVIPPKGRVKQVQYGLHICSGKVCNDLTRLGCPPNKTFVTSFPAEDQVPGHLLRSYIRGVFDGDGSLFLTTNGWHITIAGTEALLVPMLAHIRSEIPIGGGVYSQGKTKVLRIGGNSQVRTFLAWLYRDATIFMDRKHALYLTMLGG